MNTAEPTIVRLLNLLGAIRELSSFNELTADEEQLLGDLLVRWQRGDILTVSDVMLDLGDRSSSSTVYRRLVGLQGKGMVAFRVDGRDKRVKFVEPTAKADAYVQQLDQGLSRLLRDVQSA